MMRKYPSVRAFKDAPHILDCREVIATEKLNGSNFRVFIPKGVTSIEGVRYGGRESESTDPSFKVKKGLIWFKNRPGLLLNLLGVLQAYSYEDVTIYGETYGPGVISSKGTKYSNESDSLFRAFDIRVGDDFLEYSLFCEVADKASLPRVHEVWRGKPTKAAFDALLNTPSTEAALNGVADEENVCEGVVIRANPPKKDHWDQWLIVKHKNEKFTECAAPQEKREHVDTLADELARTYVTEGRLHNGFSRLHDRGVPLTKTMKDVPALLQELLLDIEKEQPEAFAAAGDRKSILSAISKVMVPLYRSYIYT